MFSTANALIEVSDDLHNKRCIGDFLDFAKVFGTLNHNLPIHEIQDVGIRGTAWDLMKFYLSERLQRFLNDYVI